jgi:hypothetical protein
MDRRSFIVGLGAIVASVPPLAALVAPPISMRLITDYEPAAGCNIGQLDIFYCCNWVPRPEWLVDL